MPITGEVATRCGAAALHASSGPRRPTLFGVLATLLLMSVPSCSATTPTLPAEAPRFTPPFYLGSHPVFFALPPGAEHAEVDLQLDRENALVVGERRIRRVGRTFLIQGHAIDPRPRARLYIHTTIEGEDWTVSTPDCTIHWQQSSGLFPVEERADRRTRWFLAGAVIEIDPGKPVRYSGPSGTRTFPLPASIGVGRLGFLSSSAP